MGRPERRFDALEGGAEERGDREKEGAPAGAVLAHSCRSENEALIQVALGGQAATALDVARCAAPTCGGATRACNSQSRVGSGHRMKDVT